MVTTGPDPSYSNCTMQKLAKDEKLVMILERADAIGKMFHKDLEIASFVGFGYEEGVRSSTIPYQGGSGPHEDDQAYINADFRATDQLGDPSNGKKTLSFHVQTCKRSFHKVHGKKCYSDTDFVSFSQPHAVVVFMTKLCGGNFLQNVLHSSEGGGGTDLIVTDYQKRTSERTRPKVLLERDAKNG